MRLSLIVTASFLAGFFVESDLIKSVSTFNYSAYLVLISFVYTTTAVVCYIARPKVKSIQLVLSSLLICCMVISSLFNLLFLYNPIYCLLVDFKQNDIVSWKNIYLAVEISALLIAGKDGLDFVSDNSRAIYNRFCDIIYRNINFN